MLQPVEEPMECLMTPEVQALQDPLAAAQLVVVAPATIAVTVMETLAAALTVKEPLLVTAVEAMVEVEEVVNNKNYVRSYSKKENILYR